MKAKTVESFAEWMSRVDSEVEAMAHKMERKRKPHAGPHSAQPSLHAKLDAIARADSHWLSVIADIINYAYKSAEGRI